MNCYKCTNTEKHKTNWYNDMCAKHKKEYRHAKMIEHNPHMLTLRGVCSRNGHNWGKPVGNVCIKCGRELKDFLKCSEAQKDRRITSIGVALNSEYFLSRMQKFRKRMTQKDKIFTEITPACKVANTLYFIRYKKHWTAERIEEEFGMARSTLNRYIFSFPWYKSINK